MAEFPIDMDIVQLVIGRFSPQRNSSSSCQFSVYLTGIYESRNKARWCEGAGQTSISSASQARPELRHEHSRPSLPPFTLALPPCLTSLPILPLSLCSVPPSLFLLSLSLPLTLPLCLVLHGYIALRSTLALTGTHTYKYPVVPSSNTQS